MSNPSFANNFSFGSETPDGLACRARPVGRATLSRMMDDPDGGVASEAITSWQPKTETPSVGVGDTVDVETQPVMVRASTQMANHVRRANAQGATTTGTTTGTRI